MKLSALESRTLTLSTVRARNAFHPAAPRERFIREIYFSFERGERWISREDGGGRGGRFRSLAFPRNRKPSGTIDERPRTAASSLKPLLPLRNCNFDRCIPLPSARNSSRRGRAIRVRRPGKIDYRFSRSGPFVTTKLETSQRARASRGRKRRVSLSESLSLLRD